RVFPMRRFVVSIALLLALASLALASPALAAAAPGRAAAGEDVEIRDGELALKAVLFRPEGAGPFPAVVAPHACRGLHNRSGQVGARYGDWAERLVAAGFVVLFPDSFASRDLGPQCSTRERERRARASRERVGDANAARRWLQGKDWIKGDRVALLGWSSRATAAP